MLIARIQKRPFMDEHEFGGVPLLSGHLLMIGRRYNASWHVILPIEGEKGI